MELDLVFFFFFFFLSLISLYSIFYKLSFTLKLDFEKIKLQKMSISLISLGKRAESCIICVKTRLAQIPLIYDNNYHNHNLNSRINNFFSLIFKNQ